MQLKCKETGKVYNITMGKILKKREAKKKDITASLISLKADDGEEIGAVIGYTKDGKFSEANKFELILDKGEKL